MKLKDKVAVVTGAQRGFGKASAIALAKEGATIVAVDMGKDIEGTASEIKQMGQRAIGLIADITSPEQIKNMVNTAIDAFGRIDILVNNAGILPRRSFLWEADDNDWRKTIEVNLIGTYNMTKAVLPLIIKNGKGRVINLSSVSGKNGSPTSSAYCASKHGIIGLTRTLAMELGLLGLTVPVILATSSRSPPFPVTISVLPTPGQIALTVISQSTYAEALHFINQKIFKMDLFEKKEVK